MLVFEPYHILSVIGIVGAISGIFGYFLMYRKFTKELEKGKRKEEQILRHAYETAVLKEIGERIGYSLDATKIVEIISGSLEKLLPYSTVSFMIFEDHSEKIRFECRVNESVNENFISDVKVKMLASFSEMLQEPLTDAEIDEGITGLILDEAEKSPVESFFNLPIVISQRVVGIINVSSKEQNLYDEDNTEVLYRIARQASEAVSKLQEILENEKGKLSQAVESLADGILMVDTKYQLLLANKKLREFLGTVERPKIFDIVNALAGSFDLRTKMEEAFLKEEALASQEVIIGERTFEVVVSKVMDQKNVKPSGVVVLFHDITDSKSLEKLRQEFMAVMVHELRAPLTAIKSTAEVMVGDLAKLKADDIRKSLKIVSSTSENMLKLVNDLLDAAKIEAGKFDVICESGDLAEVVSERVESFRPVALEKNLKLEVEIEKDLPKAVFDKVRTKQVLNNLLSNAFKYTDSGSVRVKVAKEIAHSTPVDILVSVEDTGIGLDREEIERLFSKFGQLESGRGKAGIKSAGLGLYIAKEIVEAMDGKIGVKSRGAGYGSTFYFTVPVVETVKMNVDPGLRAKEARSSLNVN